MPSRKPDRLRSRISTENDLTTCPPSPNTLRHKRAATKMCMQKLRAGWSDAKKRQENEKAKLRMQRIRQACSKANDRKSYAERVNKMKDLTNDERKRIKTEQKRKQRAYKKEKENNKVTNQTEIVIFAEFVNNKIQEKTVASPTPPLLVNESQGETVTPTIPLKLSKKARNASFCIRRRFSKMNKSDISATLHHVLKKNQDVIRAEEKDSVIINAVSSFLKPKRGKSADQTAFIKQLKSVCLKKVNRKYLTKKLKISCRRLNTMKDSRGRPKVKDGIVEQVKQVYEASSRPLPLKRKDGEMDVRILELSLKEVYQKYTDIYPAADLSFMTFCRLRPKNIRCSSTKDFMSCLCEQCLNVKLKVEALVRVAAKENISCDLPKEINSLHSMCKLAVCAEPTNDCIDQKCPNCLNNLLNCFAPISTHPKASEVKTTWKTWKMSDIQTIAKSVSTNTDGKKNTETVHVMKKRNDFVRTEGTISELIKELLLDMKTHPKHLYVADHQQAQRRLLRENQTTSMIVMDVDYSENITAKYREEPQSAHYCKRQFTLFPVSVEYIQNETNYREEILCISDDLTHDVVQADTFIKTVMDHLINERGLSPESAVHIFSDRCASQFSNRYMATFISQRKNITWNFYGVRHGKNLSDTAGANFKTLLTRHILQTGDPFDTLDSFSNLELPTPQLERRRRTVKVISLHEMKELRNEYDLVSIPALTGIKQFHQIHSSQGNGSVEVRHLTCYCTSCLEGTRQLCTNKSNVGHIQVRLMKAVHSNIFEEKNDIEERDEIAETEIDTNICSKCNENFEGTVSYPWLQCCQCTRWYCKKCLPKGVAKKKRTFFICDLC